MKNAPQSEKLLIFLNFPTLFCQKSTLISCWNTSEGQDRVERGSFTLTLSQNRAWKSPLTRLFTLNVLCIDIIWGADLSANDRKDCVPNRQAPCSGGSSLWQTRSFQTCCSNCTNLALGSQSLSPPAGVSSEDANAVSTPSSSHALSSPISCWWQEESSWSTGLAFDSMTCGIGKYSRESRRKLHSLQPSFGLMWGIEIGRASCRERV